MQKQLLTARDVASALGHKGTAHVYALIRAGELPAIKVGTRGVRIPRQAFEEHIERLNQAARLSLKAEKFAEALTQAGGALADIFTPTAEAVARRKSEHDGFMQGIQNGTRPSQSRQQIENTISAELIQSGITDFTLEITS